MSSALFWEILFSTALAKKTPKDKRQKNPHYRIPLDIPLPTLLTENTKQQMKP